MRQNAFLILLAALTFGIAQCTRSSHEAQKIEEGGDVVYEQDQVENQYHNKFFGKWDSNQNTELEQAEFHAGMESENFWDNWSWDLDANDSISQEEWKTEVFSFGDSDGDSNWSAEEWVKFKADWVWTDWDADGNGELIQSEWEAGWKKKDWFNLWDENGDGILNENEYYSYNFQIYDDKNDGSWNEKEYTDYQEDWAIK